MTKKLKQKEPNQKSKNKKKPKQIGPNSIYANEKQGEFFILFFSFNHYVLKCIPWSRLYFLYLSNVSHVDPQGGLGYIYF